MKVPDSGMPEEAYWESLFDVPLILDRLGVDGTIGDIAELGCGYGTFTLPIAARIAGVVRAFDIDPLMVERVAFRALDARQGNVEVAVRDVIAKGFRLGEAVCDACLLFNILHFGGAAALVREAARVVRPGGRVLVIHWRTDVVTPRGPAMEVRPRYAQVCQWGEAAGLKAGAALFLPPWHFGAVLTKAVKT
jgi:SAM-dependent methyltransferase